MNNIELPHHPLKDHVTIEIDFVENEWGEVLRKLAEKRRTRSGEDG